ncbi:RbsD/FucU family protein [Pararhizobium haloflavum]|uniref:RbsD/FucU family protein n=1 Tax=Pararhizobium haloflavum TaxID=2037914 RepID=UPI000C17AF42|nr:RbsD/FucU domain-containing protein [Pararhizobium haloflavum]
MLKTIPSMIDAELLWVLRSMGHGDTLTICDNNFPATSVALHTTSKRLVRVAGHDTTALAEAIFALFPLDTFIDAPIAHMQVVDAPDSRLEVHHAFKAAADRAEARDVAMTSIERHAFYEAARRSYAVVQTGEARPYGCFIVTKGVVFD